MKSLAKEILLVLVVLLAGGLPAPAANAEGENPYYLRGVGILILDPRDPPEAVKERLRQFLEQVRPNVPPELRQESNRRQLEALLEADWESGEELPQMELSFHPDMTVEMIQRFCESTPMARESAAVCPAACPLRALGPNTIHIHLTRPTGGGDSIIAFRLFNPDGSQPTTRKEREDQAVAMGQGMSDRYGEFGYERKPVTRLFGVGVVVGDPLVGGDWLEPKPNVNE